MDRRKKSMFATITIDQQYRAETQQNYEVGARLTVTICSLSNRIKTN
jgi:hypothetical protein